MRITDSPPRRLWLFAALALVALLCTIGYWPAKPPTSSPPSARDAAKSDVSDEIGDTNTELPQPPDRTAVAMDQDDEVCRIAGSVTRWGSSAPEENVRVALRYAPSGGEPMTGWAAMARGAYSIRIPRDARVLGALVNPDDEEEISASPLLFTEHELDFVVTDDRILDLGIDFERRIGGVVVDASTGAGVPDARVVLSSGSFASEAETAEDGGFVSVARMSKPGEFAAMWTFAVSHPEYKAHEVTWVELPPESSVPLRIELQRGVVVSGWLLSPSGEGLEGIELCSFVGDGPDSRTFRGSTARTRSTQDGRFVFPPQVPTQDGSILTSPTNPYRAKTPRGEGHAAQRFDGLQWLDDVDDLILQLDESVVFSFAPTYPDGSPAMGCRLAFEVATGYWITGVPSRDGTIQMVAGAGVEHRFSAWAPVPGESIRSFYLGVFGDLKDFSGVPQDIGVMGSYAAEGVAYCAAATSSRIDILVELTPATTDVSPYTEGLTWGRAHQIPYFEGGVVVRLRDAHRRTPIVGQPCTYSVEELGRTTLSQLSYEVFWVSTEAPFALRLAPVTHAMRVDCVGYEAAEMLVRVPALEELALTLDLVEE